MPEREIIIFPVAGVRRARRREAAKARRDRKKKLPRLFARVFSVGAEPDLMWGPNFGKHANDNRRGPRSCPSS